MGIFLLILYLISSIILFFLLNYVNEKDNTNYVNHILVSILYIIVLAGLFSTFGIDSKNENIFLIVIFEFVIRLFYTSYVLEMNFFKGNSFWVKIYFISIVGSYFINYIFIKNVDNVFPGVLELKIIIWLLILIYGYVFLKKYVTIKSSKDNSLVYYKDRDYIVMQYAKFKNRYYDIVNIKYRELRPMIYAIMIYENYNRPEVMRKIDKLRYKIDNVERKFGIMQVFSKNIISDEKSIELVVKKLDAIYLKLIKDKKSGNRNKAISVLRIYYSDNEIVNEIISIYNEIKLFDNR